MNGATVESSAPLPLELRLNMLDMRRTLSTMIARARAGDGFTLFTVNLDHIVKLGGDARFRAAYGRADLISADGWPIVWLARAQDRRRSKREGAADREMTEIERTTGADLLEPLCREAARYGLPLYFIGPGPQSQADGIANLMRRYPALDIAGCETPNIPGEMDAGFIEALARRIGQSRARICVVSLGAPKQEILADELRRRHPDVGFLCVGAALDFISGHARRAPRWAQRAGMEWLWRMVSDPRRLAMRYASCAGALVKMSCPAIFRGSPRFVIAEKDMPA
jgi:exopolysaccharide biosynthesis WecB/TagA/CpsF family protein